MSKTAHPPQFIFLGKLRAPKAKTARCDDAPYAATIHKSQGSEYPAVVIPVMTQHYTMLPGAASASLPATPQTMTRRLKSAA